MVQQRHQDGNSELVVDDSHYPILIVTWFGEPTHGLAHVYQRWEVEQRERAKASGTRLVSLNDGTHATRPSPSVRKIFSEFEVPDASLVLKSVVVVTNPLIRGGITAIKWVVGDKFANVDLVDSSAAAIARCFEILDQHDIARPKGLSVQSYEPPRASLRTANA